jgi:hypothetical protein
MRFLAITVFNGRSGDQVEITDPKEIVYIIENLNEITFQKGKSSFGYMGCIFRINIYNAKGKSIKEFIINSEDTIRLKGFFYYTKDNKIDYDY